MKFKAVFEHPNLFGDFLFLMKAVSGRSFKPFLKVVLNPILFQLRMGTHKNFNPECASKHV